MLGRSGLPDCALAVTPLYETDVALMTYGNRESQEISRINGMRFTNPCRPSKSPTLLSNIGLIGTGFGTSGDPERHCCPLR